MKLIVTGANGMLGRCVVAAATALEMAVVPVNREHVDLTNLGDVARLMKVLNPDEGDVITNCAGAVPERYADRPVEMLAANAMIPHVLDATKPPWTLLIHVSTDCVFGQGEGSYDIRADPAPGDLYGRSKLAGELDGYRTRTVRTSFIGSEHGLWGWFAGLPQAARIDGWANVRWSGSTALAVAVGLVTIAEHPPEDRLIHLSTAIPVSKYQVLMMLRERLNRLDVTIDKRPNPRYDRILIPTVELVPVQEALDAWFRVHDSNPGRP